MCGASGSRIFKIMALGLPHIGPGRANTITAAAGLYWRQVGYSALASTASPVSWLCMYRS